MADLVEVKVPEMGESIGEGTISAWLKQPGEFVDVGEELVEIETDKVNLEVSAEAAGVLKEIVYDAGEDVTVGAVIARLDTSANAQPSSDAPASPEAEQSKERNEKEAVQKESTAEKNPRPAREPDRSRIAATPSARRKAREAGRTLEHISTDDPHGRIRAQDVMKESDTSKPTVAEPSSRDGASPQFDRLQSDEGTDGRVERIRMSRRRKTIARRLVEAQHEAAILTTFNEVDMSAVMGMRKRKQEDFVQQYGIKLGYMSFFTKAVIAALHHYPLLNAEIRDEEIWVKKFYDIGIAVSTESGLVVPVVREADKLGFAGVEKEIARLAEKARANELELEDLQGGTFTITNGGIFGSLLSTPILNSPQVGILGMHKIQKRPVHVGEDGIENRPMMYVALSYDHRIVDGREAVQFLAKVKQLLEDPDQLLLER